MKKYHNFIYLFIILTGFSILSFADVDAKGILNKSHSPINDFASMCPPPGNDCTCRGKLTTLLLRYQGSVAQEISVVQKNNEVIFHEVVLPQQDIELIGTYKSGRGNRNITLGPWIKVYVGNEEMRIHTSCSVEINIGDVLGDFLVISGTSRRNGLICGELPPDDTFDFGDAPSSYGEASHLVSENNPYLGAIPPDVEISSQFSSDALGDDNSNNGIDDEGGSVFILSRDLEELCHNQNSFLVKRDSPTLEVITNGSGFVNAWIDWNADGAFTNDEQIISQLFSTGGVIQEIISVPRTAVSGTTFLRVRYSSDIITSATGSASDGEVEDCSVQVQ